MKQLKQLAASKLMITGLVLAVSMMLFGASAYLQAGEHSEQGYIGVGISQIPTQEKEELDVRFGVKIVSVNKESAAEKAGLKEDDVIQYFNEEKIRRVSDLIDAVRDCKPGNKVKMKIVRDGKSKVVSITVDEYKPKKFFFKSGKGSFFSSHSNVYMGVRLLKLNKDLAGYFGVKKDGGALILEVEADTPAEEAGLKSGDVIVKVDGKDVADPGDVSEKLSDKEDGDKVELTLMRQKKKQTIKVELEERNTFPGLKFFKNGDKDFHFYGSPSIQMFSPRMDDAHKEIFILKNGTIQEFKKSKEHRDKLIEELKNKKRNKLMNKELKEYKEITYLTI
jgi:C-terminal processing protease CtpA/Prc